MEFVNQTCFYKSNSCVFSDLKNPNKTASTECANTCKRLHEQAQLWGYEATVEGFG